ncbi:hypothetical protein HDU81_005348 [Chytriomyces hyalinus]|nr:hypothetical protein HDU81_005348 [Chytriomyces hyalinus]
MARSKISSPSPPSAKLKFEELTLKTKDPASAPSLQDETLQSETKGASVVDGAKPSPFKFKFQSALGNAPNWAKKTGRGPSTLSSSSANKIISLNECKSAAASNDPAKNFQEEMDDKKDDAAPETSDTATHPRPTTPVRELTSNAKGPTSHETPVKAESSNTIQKLGVTLHRVSASPCVSKGLSIVGRAKRDAGASEKLTSERDESLKSSLPKPANDKNDKKDADLAEPKATSMPHVIDSKLNDATGTGGAAYRAGIVSGNTTTWVAKAKQERPEYEKLDFVFLAGDGAYTPGMTTASRKVASSESNAARKPVKENAVPKGRGGSSKLHSGSRGAVLAGKVIGGNSGSAGYGYGGYSGSGGINARVGYKSDSVSGGNVRGGFGGNSKGGAYSGRAGGRG